MLKNLKKVYIRRNSRWREMDPAVISDNIAAFKTTKNVLYLIKTFQLLIHQKRIGEACYGIYCLLFSRPSSIKSIKQTELHKIFKRLDPILGTRDVIRRNELIDIFEDDYLISQLPSDFTGARLEAIVCNKDLLILGEYGHPGKRLALVTKNTLNIINFYTKDENVLHIHAIHLTPSSQNVFITTGDNGKYLDSWTVENTHLRYNKRLKQSLAGHTAIQKVGNDYYFGTDFSQRTNYIEMLNGKKYHFPKIAIKMFVIKFFQYQDRLLIILSKELPVFGGRYAITVFDCENKVFLYCDYQELKQPNKAEKKIHSEAIMLRSLMINHNA